jgi:hypothetical protein
MIFIVLSLFGCSSKYYTVTWVNYDGTILEVDSKVEDGAVPEYNGPTPYKESDESYSYIFTHFESSSGAQVRSAYQVTQDSTFTAQFGRLSNTPTDSYQWINIGSNTDFRTFDLTIYLPNNQSTVFKGRFRLKIYDSQKLEIYDLNDFTYMPPGTWQMNTDGSVLIVYLPGQYVSYSYSSLIP